mmetsp:Transcript_11189/g.23986  ORF Transcript_11189/g.23986 Transcript_11189/m.23986 type:complete len:89 (+) Transcript_11189:222-488(+)
MTLHVLQRLHPPVLPDIFAQTLPLRGEALQRAKASAVLRGLDPSEACQLHLAKDAVATVRDSSGHVVNVRFHWDAAALRGWGSENHDR